MPEQIAERVERAMRERAFPGCVVGILQGREEIVLPFGTLAYGADPVQAETVYDLASITKSIPLASLIHVLAHERQISIDEHVSTYLPDFKNDHGTTVGDLLRYRITGPRMSALRDRSAEEIEAAIFEHGFDGPPGESRYSNLPAYLLGIILERVAGDSLSALARRYFFDPFDMRHTIFGISGVTISRYVAPSEIDEKRGGEVRGWPHDESAYVFARAGSAVGHAGLFSTAPDLLKFIRTLFQGRYQEVLGGAVRGSGWQTVGALLGSHPHRGMFGKTGFTGTSIACDATRGIAVVILSNRTFPMRPTNADAINAFRRDIADLVFA